MCRRFEKRFFRSDSGKNLKSKTCPELSRRIENLKSEIIGWEGAATRLEARARRPIRLPQHAPFVGEGGFR